jgi:tetratricopeptide (TPR) repeat protein
MYKRCHSSISLLLLAGLLAVGARPARATPTLFERQVSAAQKLYVAGDYAGAIHELESAYQLKSDPRILFNLGKAHRKLGHTREALAYFERYRDTRAASDAAVPVDQYVAELRATLADEEKARAATPPPSAAPSSESPSPAPASERPPELSPTPKPPPAVTAVGTDARAVVPATAPRATPQPTAAADLVQKPARAATRRPLYKQWWLWTAAGVVAAAAVAVGLGVALSPRESFPSTMPSNGSFHF